MVSANDADSDADAVLCDFCASEPAVVYCRADSARLCLACDREVHAANTVSSRHNRSLLCDRCASAPAAVFCPSPSHRFVLCSNCDFDAHRFDGHHLARQALDPFSGCPSGAFLAASLSVVDEKDALPGKVEERWDWEAPPVFCWEDLILSPTASPFHGYQAMGVPPPPKDNNSSCGKRKEEIRRQIRQLIQGETDGVDYDEEIVPVMEFKSLPLEDLQLQNGPTPILLAASSCEGNYIQCNPNDSPMPVRNPAAVTNEQKIGSSSSANATFADGNMEVAPHASQLGSYNKDQANPTIKEKLSSMPHKNEVPDRSSVISRYKEKRKTRRYDKLIRYESRKTRADNRVRIKGRFAKVNLATNP